MINLLPEPKKLTEIGGYTIRFEEIIVRAEENEQTTETEGVPEDLTELIRLRFWNYKEIAVKETAAPDIPALMLVIIPRLECAGGVEAGREELFFSQGYLLNISESEAVIHYRKRAGLIHAITSLKQLLCPVDGGFKLPLCGIVDYPSVAVRAVAQTFSWYAGYGRFGFDSQLWGREEWEEYLNICLDNKINQFNLVMYGYWPFDMPGYPETSLRDIPIKIWNAENRRWLTVHYTHPNLEEPFLEDFIRLAHKLEVGIFAYVGLNSYNGAYSIKHPEARMKPPQTGGFLNDFDSLCLSSPENVEYIVESMRQIARLGFDGYTLEESEEGFWFCECEECKKHWHAVSATPGEAKHKANMWLLRRIYDAVRAINPQAVIGIRAFRQPPLVKDPEFLKECADSMPEDIMLFWAPGLYVPESEFAKWCDAFGKDRIWGRDTEANSITSTMGRLYRTFRSNMLRYEDESNEQVIETDIRQHKGSAQMGVHGINGFMFEWYGLFLHLFAHGNYGWGSRMEEETFYRLACELNFGKWGGDVLYVMKNMLTIHESQLPLYTTPFPFQKNKITDSDIPAILAAKERHPRLMEKIETLQQAAHEESGLRPWLAHFDKWSNAERRNAVIYEMALTSLAYERETDPEKKEQLLDDLLEENEKDFDIVKEMFFDINPVRETGVGSCMFPYHEMKRLIHNIRHPQAPDEDVISSGVEAFGWLWL